jgi:hypothetical protein
LSSEFCPSFINILGHNEPHPPVHQWRMNGKWSGNSFLLGSSSLANHGWLPQLLLFSLTYLLTTHKTNNSFIVAPVTVFTFYSLFFFIYGDGKPLESLFNLQFRFMAIFHHPKKKKKKSSYLPCYLPTSCAGPSARDTRCPLRH